MSASSQQTPPQRPARDAALRIGTLNVNGLASKLTLIVALAAAHSVDLLCLQETHLSQETTSSAMAAASKAGWKLLCGTPAYDTAGRGTAGVAILTRWPATLAGKGSGQQAGRWMAAMVHRPHSRPFEVLNLYLPANNQGDAQTMAETLLAEAATRGEQRMLIGDWNLTPFQEPIQTVHRNGALHLADDLLGPALLNTTTRSSQAGRFIDFALCSSPLAPTARGQVVADISDHDLVWYDLDFQGDFEPSLCSPPKRRLQATHAVQPEQWEQIFPKEVFQRHVREQNVEKAWQVLSDSAENALQAGTGPGRTWVGPPVQQQMPPVKVEALQTVRERRLRRFHRRLQESIRQPHCHELSARVWRTWIGIRDWHPELGSLTFSDPSDLQAVSVCIAREKDAATSRRIAQWQQRMENSEAATIRWVKRDVDEEVYDADAPVHPQLKVEHLQRKWSDVWNPQDMQQVEAIRPFLQQLREPAPCEALVFTPASLRRIVCKGQHKAAGPDGWKPAHWALLPDSFFESLSLLWDLILRACRLPEAWLKIRCVLIPKQEGEGFRPISVAAIGWRVGLTAIMNQLHPWLESWLPESVVGGLRNKGTADAHASLHDDVVQALNSRTPLYGAKLDVSKCFDSVIPAQAIMIFEHQGAPPQLTSLLALFYGRASRRFEFSGVVAANALTCARGLLQGCPASCGLLAGVMAVWHSHVTQTANIKCSVFVDDRTIWAQDDHQQVVRALQATAEVDAACGLQLNRRKCAGFATGLARQRVLKQALGDIQLDWEVSGKFRLLGVSYNLTRHRRTPANEQAAVVALKRLSKIRILNLSWHKKKRIIRSLVIPLFSHVGAWHTLSRVQLGKWRRQIELAILRPIRGRSRFLLWAGLFGADLDPEFVLDFAVIRHELWRIKKGLAPRKRLQRVVRLPRGEQQPQQQAQPAALRPQPARAVPSAHEPDRVVEVLAKWGWTQLSDTKFRTQRGVLDLAWDGYSAIKQAAVLGWERSLWDREPRALDADTMPLHGVAHPCCSEHKVWLQGDRARDRPSLRTALGAGFDGHIGAAVSESEVRCCCGEPVPSRQHLTWRCAHQRHAAPLRQPVNGAELRLLLPSVPFPTDLHCRHLEADARRLSNHLFQEYGLGHAPVVVATDGSCIGRKLSIRRAAWSVVTQDGYTCAGALPGLDQCAPAAEAYAFAVAAQASQETGIPVHIVTDCKMLLRLASNAARGLLPHTGRSAIWHLLRCASISWIPSHGKQPEYRHPWLDTALVRGLNEKADKAAVAACESRLRLASFQEWSRATEVAEQWESVALRRQHAACEALRASLVTAA